MKKLLSFVLVLTMLLPFCCLQTAAADLSVTIDGSAVPYDSTSGKPYQTTGGILMVPVDRTMEYFGVDRLTDRKTGELLLQMGIKEVRLKSGSAKMIVNGNVVQLPTAAKVSSGVLYAPVRELVTALGGYYQLSGSQLKIFTQQADSEMVRYLHGKSPSDLWTVWNNATSKYKDKKYSEAIPLFIKCIPGFASSYDNSMLLFSKLAVCYARTGDYDRAAAAYSRASHFAGKNYPQTQIVYYECAKSIRTEISLYLHTKDLSFSQEKTHGVGYEPTRGIVLGYTAEQMQSCDFATQAAKKPKMWLLYFQFPSKEIAAKVQQRLSGVPNDVIVELAVEPSNGFSAISDNAIATFAKAVHASGKKVMVRYANEMNESQTPWFTDGETYKQAFIRFANIMRQHAPEVPLIWAPNFWPMNNVDDYYPGDAYVDYVGVSSYVSTYYHSNAQVSAGYDVLGNGISTDRWSQQIDFLYNHYGYKKPIIIAEGAASTRDRLKKTEEPDKAAARILDFYTYLPMRYPNMKYAVYFNLDNPGKNTYYVLTTYPQTINAYNKAISDDQFLSSESASSEYCYVPFDTLTDATYLSNTKQELCAFVKYGDDTKVKKVRYEINGTSVGTTTQAPYTLNVDFSRYAGQSIQIRVVALDASGKTLTSKRFMAKVGLNGPATHVCPCAQFVDMPAYGTPEHEAIDWAYTHTPYQVTAGMDETHFSPDEIVTRAQAMTFLWAAKDKPAPKTTVSPFTDVKINKWYAKPILWAVENGITVGTGDNKFSPNKTCNRAEMLTFLYAMLGKPGYTIENPYSDVNNSKWFKDTAIWAYENGIELGENGKFHYKTPCTRASTVLYLYRALVKKAE